MNLKKHLQSLYKFSDEELDMALGFFFQEKFKKGDFYLREGQFSNKNSSFI